MRRYALEVPLNSDIMGDSVNSQNQNKIPLFILMSSPELGKQVLKNLPIDSSSLKKILWIERKSENIQKIPEDFYIKILASIKLIKAFSNSEDLKREADYLATLALDLLRKRLQKIIKIAETNPSLDNEILEKLSFEERIIYRKICEIVGGWEKTFIKYLDGGVEWV